ncbi:MAG: ComF family protein [Prevotellaceae bacterium]|jgi:ComF family protein|nr:ComF family protein [Prevotellaceae bacterium]
MTHNRLSFFHRWAVALLDLFIPRRCSVCGIPLDDHEQGICTQCNADMPRTGYHLLEENPMKALFEDYCPVERATAYFFYRKKSLYDHIIFQFKYEGKKEVAALFGQYLAMEIAPDGFFEGIDLLVPVPLHPKRKRKRGYNQSEWIARGISLHTGIPIDATSLVRTVATKTQTRKNAAERRANVAGIFALRCPEQFRGKHLLIIDDVVTTGSTVAACAEACLSAGEVRISVLALSVVDFR